MSGYVPDPRLRAVDDWRAYCRQHKATHDFTDETNGLLLLGFLDGARAILAFLEQCTDLPEDHVAITSTEKFVEELRQCYCQHFGLDPDEKGEDC